MAQCLGQRKSIREAWSLRGAWAKMRRSRAMRAARPEVPSVSSGALREPYGPPLPLEARSASTVEPGCQKVPAACRDTLLPRGEKPLPHVQIPFVIISL